MRVLYDHQIFTFQEFGGISRYFTELMEHYYKNGEVLFDLSLAYSNNVYLNNAPFSHHQNFFKQWQFKGKYVIPSFANKKLSKKALSKQDFDIFHPTYYDPYFLKHLNKKPFVLTIVDMIHEIFPQIFPKVDATSENKRILAEEASKIIAISDNTKYDIIRFFGIDESKISVIYLGSSLKQGLYTIKLNVPEKYILFVGNRGLYKNFNTFIRSVAPLIQKDQTLFVICAGGGSFTPSELNLLDGLKISNKVWQYSADDKILSYLYSKALVFVYPSLYEGFGIPILEAFNCGCPVALSNSSSFPEVAADGGLYFNPQDVDSIRSVVSEVIYDEKRRNILISEGFKRLHKFSWENTAQKTASIYKELL
jgi:glycosyltransferase involved in cell wall biosynthesis